MDYSEFRRHLGKAGLTINDFAALIGVNPNSVSNYSGRTSVPIMYALTVVLLGDTVDRGVDFRTVLLRYGISPVSRHTGPQKVSQLDAFRARKRPIR